MNTGGRIGAMWVLVGTNGTGKSTQLKKLLKHNRRNLIIPSTRDDIAWAGIPELKPQVAERYDELRKKSVTYYFIKGLNTFTGNRVVYVDRPEVFDAVCDPVTGFKNGGLFMDDFKNYVRSQGLLKSNFKTMLGNRRHRMLDLFFAAWAFEDVNAEMFAYRPKLFVFDVTRAPGDSLQKKVANYDELMEVYSRVRSKNAARPANRRFYAEPFQVR